MHPTLQGIMLHVQPCLGQRWNCSPGPPTFKAAVAAAQSTSPDFGTLASLMQWSGDPHTGIWRAREVLPSQQATPERGVGNLKSCPEQYTESERGTSSGNHFSHEGSNGELHSASFQAHMLLCCVASILPFGVLAWLQEEEWKCPVPAWLADTSCNSTKRERPHFTPSPAEGGREK